MKYVCEMHIRLNQGKDHRLFNRHWANPSEASESQSLVENFKTHYKKVYFILKKIQSYDYFHIANIVKEIFMEAEGRFVWEREILDVKVTTKDAILLPQGWVGAQASLVHVRLTMYQRGDITDVSSGVENREPGLLITDDVANLEEGANWDVRIQFSSILLVCLYGGILLDVKHKHLTYLMVNAFLSISHH